MIHSSNTESVESFLFLSRFILFLLSRQELRKLPAPWAVVPRSQIKQVLQNITGYVTDNKINSEGLFYYTNYNFAIILILLLYVILIIVLYKVRIQNLCLKCSIFIVRLEWIHLPHLFAHSQPNSTCVLPAKATPLIKGGFVINMYVQVCCESESFPRCVKVNSELSIPVVPLQFQPFLQQAFLLLQTQCLMSSARTVHAAASSLSFSCLHCLREWFSWVVPVWVIWTVSRFSWRWGGFVFEVLPERGSTSKLLVVSSMICPPNSYTNMHYYYFWWWCQRRRTTLKFSVRHYKYEVFIGVIMNLEICFMPPALSFLSISFLPKTSFTTNLEMFRPLKMINSRVSPLLCVGPGGCQHES